MNTDDAAQWRRVQWYVRDCVVIGLIVAGILYLSPTKELQSKICFSFLYKNGARDTGQFRAALFFIFSYLFVLPVYALKAQHALRHLKIKKLLAIHEKVLITILSCGFFVGVFTLPYLILSHGAETYWRSRSLYLALTDSYLGLAVLGGVMVYGAILALLVLLGAVPKIWLTTKMED